jgi:hypothetical protein
MASGVKFYPFNGVVLDRHQGLMDPEVALFIKNLNYSLTDTSGAQNNQGAQTGVGKPIESNYLYGNVPLPSGTNFVVGSYASKPTVTALVLVWNSNKNHTLYQIDGSDQSIQIVYQGPCLDLSNQPEYFVGEGQCYLQIVYLTDPVTAATIQRTFFYYTTGQNTQKSICIEDSIATNGFSPIAFPYFISTYDPCWMVRMGVPTPTTCVSFQEIPITAADAGINNKLIYNTWQFRIQYTDVWGRPSEHSIISNLYIPGINDCIAGSTGIPRCLLLGFDAGPPNVNTIQVEFRNGNNTQWYVDTTLYLYNGSNIGEWWNRSRNTDGTFQYDPNTNQISYTFCRNKECNPVPTTETIRIENPLPNTSQSIAKLGQYLALGNNTDGFLPWSQDLIDDFEVTVTPPTATTGGQLRNITILVPIWNQEEGSYQQVTKVGTTGYVWGDNGGNHGGAKAYSQFFTNTSQSGFLGYLAGTSNYVISSQVYLNAAGEIVPDPNFNGLATSPGRLSFQQFVFSNVQPGTYIFRLASHLADPTQTTNWATTSTTVWGRCPFNATKLNLGQPWSGGFDPTPQTAISPQLREPSQELIINVCSEDYSTLNDNQILLIADLAYDVTQSIIIGSTSEPSRSTCGYFYETAVNGFDQYPVELIKVSGANGFNSMITDHNGFYYFSTAGSGRTYGFTFIYRCTQQSIPIGSGNQGMTFHNVILDEFLAGGVAVFSDFNTLPCNRILIEGQVILLPQGIPVPNVTVVLSRGSTATTDDEGNFTLVAHDDVTKGTRNDILIIANSGCNYVTSTGGCIAPINITINPCIAGTCVARILTIPAIDVYFNALKGPTSGGAYQVGGKGYDWMGRCGDIQPLATINIPSFFQTGVLGPSTVSVSIPSGTVFPLWMEYLTFSVTAEINWGGVYQTWIVDRVQLIDNTGNVNDINPSQIKVYYASLIEYNKQNNYNTTDAWSFIPTSQTTPATGDQVSFFINGDGTFYTANISLVKYDQVGQYFLIDYTAQLANLASNALMRLMRPALCTAQQAPYYELCGIVKVNKGVAAVNSVVLNIYDAYYLSMAIPVPTPLTSSTAGLNVTTTTTSVSAGITTTESYTVLNPATTNELRTFGFLFEHNSPSNFWGQSNWNIGRVATSDPYETEVHTPDGIAISGALSPTDQLNFLNYFDDALKVSYDNANLNGIVAMMVQMSEVFIIGQSNNFKTGFSDNLLRGNADGTASIASINNALGQPETKAGQTFGCLLVDKSTISEFNGIVMFLDRAKTAVVRYDYAQCRPISYNVCDSYIVPKIKDVMQYNLNGGNRYFIGKINQNNSEYLLTDFMQDAPTYVNQLRYYDVTQADTIAFDSRSGIFKGWYGQTPEYYSGLEGELNDQQLFTFMGGLPYANYSTNNPSYGTIFGQQVLPIYRFIFSLGKDKKGKLLSVAVYCKESAYFVDQLLTETGQSSRILLNWFNQAMYFWQAPSLCDLNTPFDPNLPIATGPNKLTDGNNLVGTWFDFRFVGDPANANTYSELQSIDVFVFGAEKSGT